MVISTNFSIVKVENNISFSPSSKPRRNNHDGMIVVQEFICNFLPIAVSFIHEFAAIRSILHEVKADLHNLSKDEIIEVVDQCDFRMRTAHKEGVKFVLSKADEYFKSNHSFSLARDNVSISARYFIFPNIDNESIEEDALTENYNTEVLADLVWHIGKRKLRDRVPVLKDAALVSYGMSDEEIDTRNIEPFMCNDLLTRTVTNDYFHPDLPDATTNAIRLLVEKYNSIPSKFSRLLRSSHATSAMNQWNAIWPDDCMSASTCTFPITLANNMISENLQEVFRSVDEFGSSEVLGVITFDSPDVNAFLPEDGLMGRVFADALFLFAGCITHYAYSSELRTSFDILKEADYKIEPK